MPHILVGRFEGLIDQDFEVYDPACWSSNVHNLERMKTKERLMLLARRMRGELDDAALVLEATSEIPSVWNGRSVRDQWAYLLRSDEERARLRPVMAEQLDLATRVRNPSEHQRFALLFVRLAHEAVEIGLGINRDATIDLANLIARAERDAAGLTAILDAIPDDVRIDGKALDAAAVISRARAVRTGEVEWLTIVRRYDRDAALARGVELGDDAHAVVAAVWPLYAWLAWGEDNDHVGVHARLDAMADERARHAEEAREAELAADKARLAREEKARARAEARKAEQEWQSRPRPARPRLPPREESTPPSRVAPRPRRRDETPAPVQAAVRHEPAPKPSRETRPKPPRARAERAAPTFADGERCRLTRGLFTGKEGEVLGSDKKGYYTVRVGSLEVRVTSAELEKV